MKRVYLAGKIFDPTDDLPGDGTGCGVDWRINLIDTKAKYAEGVRCAAEALRLAR